MKSDLTKQTESSYFQLTSRLSVSLIFILPLLIIYEAGLIIVQPEYQNGAGAFIKILTQILGNSLNLNGLLVFNTILIIIILIAFLKSKNTGGLKFEFSVIMCCESLIYGLLMFMFAILYVNIIRIADEHLQLVINPATHQKLYNVLTAIIYSFGAGVYEEIVFRLVMLSFLIFFLSNLIPSGKDKDNFAAILLSLIISGLLFAAAHGITDSAQHCFEPMIFRTVSGIIFGAIFLIRGLAVAVYMHTIYDLLVFLIY